MLHAWRTQSVGETLSTLWLLCIQRLSDKRVYGVVFSQDKLNSCEWRMVDGHWWTSCRRDVSGQSVISHTSWSGRSMFQFFQGSWSPSLGSCQQSDRVYASLPSTDLQYTLRQQHQSRWIPLLSGTPEVHEQSSWANHGWDQRLGASRRVSTGNND